MNHRANLRKTSRGLKIMAVLYLLLVGASLLLVHSQYYEPGVSYVLLYLSVIIAATASIAVLLLPEEQFSGPFSSGVCLLFAAATALMTFFSGGISSELYLLFLPLIGAAALHGSWRVGLVTLIGSLLFYTLAILPGLLNDGVDSAGMTPIVLYRLGAILIVGVLLLFPDRREVFEGSEEDQGDYYADNDGSILVMRMEKEIKAHKGVSVATVLVDPGPEVEDVDLLLERVRSRISDPVLLGEETVFGFVLSGANDREVESAARRALAAASSLGAKETRAGAAIYPRDARSANELLSAAGRALEAAFEVDSPSAIVLSGRERASRERASRERVADERGYRAAR